MKPASTISHRPIFSIVMIGALAVLLPLLAVLQYRWIGQVSEIEGQRLRQTLNLTTRGSTRDLNNELEQIVNDFRLGQSLNRRGEPPRPFTDQLLQSFTNQLVRDYDSWQATSLNSTLLRNVYLYNVRDRQYRRFDPVSGSLLEETPAIAGFERWFDDPYDIPEARLDPAEFADGRFWLVASVRRGRQPFGQPENWTLFEIDPEVFWNEVVPAIMAARFDQTDYKVAIERTRDRRLLYASDETLAAGAMEEFDFREAIQPRPPRRDFGLIGPALRVVTRHELGSLADAVEAARRRNLAVGFGILALLGVSGSMIIVWSERVRSVGRLQMEFAAGISHELRTPLATIRTAAHNIAAGVVKTPEQIREYAGIVESEGRRLSAMVDQSIQFAQTEAGRRHYDLHPVQVGEVIDRAVQTALPSAREGGNRIEVHEHRDLPNVLADETALTHCLVNLLTNAIKFGAPDKAIAIDARHDGKTDHVLLSVHNEGPGIAADELPNLFEPFYRGHDTSHLPGSGLGLSLVRRMMVRQKGDVTVHTEPGKGATFTLHIPVVAAGIREPEQAPR